MPQIDTQDADRQQDLQFRKALGVRIRGMRKDRGWTLRDMVVQHDFHLSAWQGFESGRVGMSLRSLLRVAGALGTHPSELLAGIEIPGPKRQDQNLPLEVPVKPARKGKSSAKRS